MKYVTDSERNAYLTKLANFCGKPDNIKYINSVLYVDNTKVLDSYFVGTMENMFNALEKAPEFEFVA